MYRKRPKITNTDIESKYFYLRCMHDLGIDPIAREIYLAGEPEADAETSVMGEPGVEFIMASRFIKNLRSLELDSNDPILIHMKTCGGSWMEGMAIYDTIKACPCVVTILNYTHARSMSSLILQAADSRVMMPNSEFMFHHGEYGDSGELMTVISNLEFYKRSIDIMCNIYVDVMKNTRGSKWTGTSRQQVRQWLDKQMDQKNDVFMSAEEAVKNGFADCVFDGDWKGLK